MSFKTILHFSVAALFCATSFAQPSQFQLPSVPTPVPNSLKQLNPNESTPKSYRAGGTPMVQEAPPSSETVIREKTEVQDNIVSSLPAVSTDVIAPKKINVGESAKLVVMLQNFGENEVSGLKLLVSLPAHLKLQSSNPQSIFNAAGTCQFAVNRIGAGQKRQIELNVIPTQKKGITVGTELQFSVRNAVQIDVRQPKVDLSVSAPKRMMMGKTVQHKLTISNTGDGGAKDVELRIDLPRGTKIVKGGIANNKIGYLPAGESREVIIETETEQSGLTEFGYQVLSKSIRSITKQHKVFFLRPELYVEAKGPKVNFVSREGLYSVSIKNPSDVALSGTRVVIEMPTNMEITTISRAGDVDNKSKIATWKIGHIQPGETELIQFKAKIGNAGQHNCQITVSSNETVSNQFELKTQIYTRPDLQINVSNSTGPIQTGDTAEFVINAKNLGSQTAEGVKVAVDLPEWVKAVESTRYTIDAEKNQIVFKAMDLTVQENVKLKFSVIGKQGGNYVVRTTMSHSIYPRPLISEASLFVVDKRQEKVGQSSSANGVNRK